MTEAPGLLNGVFAPVLTPFHDDLSPDAAGLVAHCRWLSENGAGLSIFGTSSEANSLSVSERRALLEAVVEGGVPTDRLMPGTGCCNIPETVELSRAAVEAGAAGVLMLPPFYYKNVDDDGLFDYYAQVIERVADPRLRIYLYHIPQVSSVALSIPLIERLLKRFPDAIAGIKDSGGEWSNTQALLDAFRGEAFSVFAGFEAFLLPVLRGGGAGCISATANVTPAAIVRLYETWQQEDADAQHEGLLRTHAAFAKHPRFAALKAAVAQETGQAHWVNMRPPLQALPPEQRAILREDLEKVGFAMPGRAAMEDTNA